MQRSQRASLANNLQPFLILLQLKQARVLWFTWRPLPWRVRLLSSFGSWDVEDCDAMSGEWLICWTHYILLNVGFALLPHPCEHIPVRLEQWRICPGDVCGVWNIHQALNGPRSRVPHAAPEHEFTSPALQCIKNTKTELTQYSG